MGRLILERNPYGYLRGYLSERGCSTNEVYEVSNTIQIAIWQSTNYEITVYEFEEAIRYEQSKDWERIREIRDEELAKRKSFWSVYQDQRAKPEYREITKRASFYGVKTESGSGIVMLRSIPYANGEIKVEINNDNTLRMGWEYKQETKWIREFGPAEEYEKMLEKTKEFVTRLWTYPKFGLCASKGF